MAFVILTQNGQDNTNIDGARGEFFNSGMRDGIVKGAFNEGSFTALSNTLIGFDTCELRIGGHRILIDQMYTESFGSVPSSNIRYSLVAQIAVDNNSQATFTLFSQLSTIELRKDKLYKNANGSGVYQVEIGRFTKTTAGTITDVVRTLDLITGGSSGMGEHFIAGDITTVMLDAGMSANVTAEDKYNANGDYEQTDFTFELPETAGTVVKVNNVEQANLDFTSDPQTQLNNKVDKVTGKGLSENDYTTTEKNKLAGIEAEANKIVVDSALSATSENPVQNKVIKSGLDSKADLTNASQVITLGGLKDGNNENYKAVLPDTTGWTENKTLAITDIIDFMLDQSIDITNNPKVIYINVDLSNYDYKLEMLIAKSGDTSYIGCFPANNNSIINWSDRWSYNGIKSTTNNQSTTPSGYTHEVDTWGAIYFIDDDLGNKPNHLNNITAEMTGGNKQSITYKSFSVRSYLGNYEIKNAGGVIFGSNDATQIAITTGNRGSSNAVFTGSIRVYKRPKFSA